MDLDTMKASDIFPNSGAAKTIRYVALVYLFFVVLTFVDSAFDFVSLARNSSIFDAIDTIVSMFWLVSCLMLPFVFAVFFIVSIVVAIHAKLKTALSKWLLGISVLIVIATAMLMIFVDKTSFPPNDLNLYYWFLLLWMLFNTMVVASLLSIYAVGYIIYAIFKKFRPKNSPKPTFSKLESF